MPLRVLIQFIFVSVYSSDFVIIEFRLIENIARRIASLGTPSREISVLGKCRTE